MQTEKQVKLKQTRTEALNAKEKYYFTGKACVNGHISKRDSIYGSCYQCRIEKQRETRMALSNVNSIHSSEKNAISKNDEAIALLLYSIDCIGSGHLLRAKDSISQAIGFMEKDDVNAVHSRVIELIGGK